MPQDFAWLIITALATTVGTLSGVIFKLLTDRVKELNVSNDKLRESNDLLRSQQAEMLRVQTSQTEVMQRIMSIVEALRERRNDYNDESGEPTRRMPAPRTPRQSGR